MPWCPKCGNEYREGVTVCADCGCDLVEEEPVGDLVSLIFGDEKQMTSLKKYLEFNGVKQVSLRFDEKEEVYELLVRKADQKKASLMVRVFLAEEAQKENAGETVILEELQESEPEESRKEGENREAFYGYRKSAERAEENRSSAWVLLIAGTAGLVVMILGMAGVLPFRIGNPYMFYGVMSAVFLLFLVMGVVSMKNARVFARKAESENSLQETLTDWCLENLKAQEIDEEIGGNGQEAEETLYFKRYEAIKGKLNRQFVNLDQAFLDHFIDETVYDMVYGAQEQQ